MSIVLGFDLETTGLDTSKDRIIELGAVAWDFESKTPLEVLNKFVLPPPEFLPLSEEVKNVTGIKEEWLTKYGTHFEKVLSDVEVMVEKYGITHIFAHNGENYDRPLFMAEIGRLEFTPKSPIIDKLEWVDTRSDLPHVTEPDSRKLKHMALDHGFIPAMQHRAFADCLTMMRVASHYPLDEIIAQSKIPWVTVRALVDYNDRDKAKELRYSWEKIGDKTYPKMWVKKIRENKLASEQEAATLKGFKAVKIEN